MNNVEEIFFKEFNIPKKKPCKYNYGCGHAVPCEECPREDVFPELNLRVVYKLMEILIHWRGSMEIKPCNVKYDDILHQEIQ